MEKKEGFIGVRVRTSSKKAKSLQQYQELMRNGEIVKAVIICEMKNGNFNVLGQGMDLEEIAQSLLAASHGISHALHKEVERDASTVLDPGVIPENKEALGLDFESSRGRKRVPEITKKPETGELVAPAGESFVYCAECGSSKWFATESEQGNFSRIACVGCGNEIKLLAFNNPPATMQ